MCLKSFSSLESLSDFRVARLALWFMEGIRLLYRYVWKYSYSIKHFACKYRQLYFFLYCLMPLITNKDLTN